MDNAGLEPQWKYLLNSSVKINLVLMRDPSKTPILSVYVNYMNLSTGPEIIQGFIRG